MTRIKTIFTWVHIGLWILFSLIVGLQLKINESVEGLDSAVAVISTCLYVFYCHFFLLTRNQGKRKKAAYFFKIVGIILTGPLPFLIFHTEAPKSPNQSLDLYFMNLMTAVPLFLFLSWVARVIETLVLNTFKKEQLEKQAAQAELYYLKAQINPHFLFNTLNNIHTLVYKQAPAAPEAVMRLASLMRYMIYESNADKVPLSREIDYLQDYISLQQLRYTEYPIVTLEIVGDVNSVFIAPLLFVHFMENAYKHSHSRLKRGDITVTIEITENTLIFNIQNPVAPKQLMTEDEPGGIGFANITKRLQLLYPETHSLEISTSDDKYVITLIIKDLYLQPYER